MADIAALVELFETSDLTELSIEQPGRKLFLRRGDVPAAAEPPQTPAETPPANLTVKAHMVGFFYWNKDKSGKSPLALRQRVEKGQVVGCIQAMGLMNEVEAAQAGAVVEIAVAGGQPVEYGQTLAVLDPD